MGCASSKQKRCCSHCNAPLSPVPRSYSMRVHHPPQREGDSYHIVTLTSTTLRSFRLDSTLSDYHTSHKLPENGTQNSFTFQNANSIEEHDNNKKEEEEEKKKEFSMVLNEAKTWSSMIQQKLPKSNPGTPIGTPSGEPQIISMWELMEGVKGNSPYRSPNHFRSFSFDQSVVSDNPPTCTSQPLWFQITEDVITDFDPEVLSSFRKSSQDLSFDGDEKQHVIAENPFSSDVTKEKTIIEGNDDDIADFDPEVISSFRKSLQDLSFDDDDDDDDEKQHVIAENPFSSDVTKEKTIIEGNDAIDLKIILPPFKKDKVIFYFTSLHGVRKTYEDCCKVRLILKGMGVRVDERDVSMHSGFRDELKDLLGDRFSGIGLPVVFIGSNFIGGAEEIQRLHENDKLEKLLNCCERVHDEHGSTNSDICEACGDIRFVPCETCSGSCKIYLEADDGEVGGQLGFQRCPDCNENGLIRCPLCCL